MDDWPFILETAEEPGAPDDWEAPGVVVRTVVVGVGLLLSEVPFRPGRDVKGVSPAGIDISPGTLEVAWTDVAEPGVGRIETEGVVGRSETEGTVVGRSETEAEDVIMPDEGLSLTVPVESTVPDTKMGKMLITSVGAPVHLG
jgi:hypothetical protein